MRRLSGPFAEACHPLDSADGSGWQLCLSAGFGAGSHRPNHPAVLEGNHGGILGSSGLATIFAGPESAGFFGLERFTGESPSYAPHKFGGPMPVHHQAMEPDVIGLHPPDLALFPPPLGGCRGEKWQLHRIDRSAKDQNNNNQPFSGLPKASTRDEGLFFEKNHLSPRFITPLVIVYRI